MLCEPAKFMTSPDSGRDVLCSGAAEACNQKSPNIKAIRGESNVLLFGVGKTEMPDLCLVSSALTMESVNLRDTYPGVC